MTDKEIVELLKNYNGPDVSLMEICGSHTAAIVKSGIRSFLSPHIRMVSGPGCPVCVTVTSYIDRLIALSGNPENVICSFGDLLRVPGSRGSLEEARAGGNDIRMLYSPFDMLEQAAKDSLHNYIFAAVGFETTAPVYASLIESAIENDVSNIRILTSIKTMPEVVKKIGSKMDGYLLPGHVCTITGYGLYEPIAAGIGRPMVAAGFEAENIVQAIYALVKLKGKGIVKNFYPAAVTEEGNKKAQRVLEKYFEPGDAAWRGMGSLAASGLYLKEEYSRFDAGSRDLTEDFVSGGCRCAYVITGEEESRDCPLFGKVCTPLDPRGACMVSREGACFNEYLNR